MDELHAYVCVLCETGTNDKAGSPYYIQKFVSLQAVKTQFDPLTHWSYDWQLQRHLLCNSSLVVTAQQ